MHVLTTGEAAELLRVCPATIRRMIRRRELDGGTRRSLGRVTLASIERLLGAPLHLADDPGDIEPSPMSGGAAMPTAARPRAPAEATQTRTPRPGDGRGER